MVINLTHLSGYYSAGKPNMAAVREYDASGQAAEAVCREILA
jgi:hypothetical protein